MACRPINLCPSVRHGLDKSSHIATTDKCSWGFIHTIQWMDKVGVDYRPFQCEIPLQEVPDRCSLVVRNIFRQPVGGKICILECKSIENKIDTGVSDRARINPRSTIVIEDYRETQIGLNWKSQSCLVPKYYFLKCTACRNNRTSPFCAWLMAARNCA